MMSKKKFEKMTKAEKCVAIAKDVLKQLHIGKIKATSGVYLGHVDSLKNGNQYIYAKPNQPCQACALGALFVSKYNLFNGYWENNISCVNLQNRLYGYFSEEQLDEIEDFFEYSCMEEVENDEDRMIMIMQNIIDHKGKFQRNVKYEMV